MDKTEEYVEMCRQAWKYLLRKGDIKYDDVVAYKYVYDGYISEGVDYFFCIAEKWMIKENYEDTYIFVVWKQDQLQKIAFPDVRDTVNIRLNSFANQFCFERYPKKTSGTTATYLLTTEEKLWLAFAMKRRRNKVWNGKEWTSGKAI